MGWDFELGAGTGGFDLELGWDLKMGARTRDLDSGNSEEGERAGS